jgi:hypothetical protein
MSLGLIAFPYPYSKSQSPLPIATQVRSLHRRLPDPIRQGNRTKGSPAAIFSRLSSGFHRLVGGIPTPLKNMKVSWDDDIPNIWKVIKFMFQTTNQFSFAS